MNRLTVTMSLVAGSSLLLPAAASAASLSGAPGTVKAGKSVSVAVSLSGESSCQLTGPGLKAVTAAVSGQKKVTFSWKVPSKTRSGSYTVKVRCGSKTVTAKVKVKGKKKGPKKLGPASVKVAKVAAPKKPVAPKPTAPTTPTNPTTPVTPTQPAQPQSAEELAESYFQQLRGYNTGTGQCTEYAMNKREDLFRAINYPRALTWAQAGFGGNKPEFLGNASEWARLAAESGIAVSSIPKAGGWVTFQPGVKIMTTGGSGTTPSTGHIGFVEAVNGDGTVTVSDMNGFAGLHNTGTYTLTASGAVLTGVAYIG